MQEYDVVVVGAGNAAFCAALAAQEQGASVLMLEAAPEDESGGNSRFTAGSIRVVYNGVDDILRAAGTFEKRLLDCRLLLFIGVVIREQNGSRRDRIHLDVGRVRFRQPAIHGNQCCL